MNKRVYISGTSGIGKTTLAKALSNAVPELPFLNGSSKVLWNAWDIKSHKDIIKMCQNDPMKGMEFQTELLNYRRNLIGSLDSNFVSDRSVIDNMVYALLQLGPYLPSKLMDYYLEECRRSVTHDSMFIVLTLGNETVKDGYVSEVDGKRINNYTYNRVISNTMIDVAYGVIGDLGINPNHVLLIQDWNMDKRISKCLNFLHKRWQ